MEATIQQIQNPRGCGHRVIVFNVGSLPLHIDQIIQERPTTLAEAKEEAIIILKHQWLTYRAAGRTPTQATNDLIGFTVRV